MLNRVLLGTVAALALGGAAIAQTSKAPSSPAVGSSKFLASQIASEKTSSDLVGMTVYNREGDDIGKISNLIIDQDHKVKGAILSVGGFLGLGSKSVAVPMDMLRMEKKDGKDHAVISMSKDELAKAPDYKTLAEVRAEAQRATDRAAAPARPADRGTAPAR